MDKKKLFTVMSLAIGLGTLTVLSDNTKINVSATDTSSVQKFGDINNDGFVDTVDATAVLIEYAHLSTSGKGTFTEVQTKNADIDNNGLVDAVDSAYILSYYAYVSAGGNTGFREWADEKINSSRPSTTTTTQSVQTTVSNSTTTTTTTTTVSGISKVSEIRLSKTEMKIEVGKTDISYVTMLPESATNKDEIWTSSDEKVATVDKWGNVKGVANGVCTVTVTSVDNPTVKAEIKVTVGKGNTNKVSEIKLSKTEMSIEVGKADISYVTMLPESATNKDEVWTSSDEKVATVDKWGNVKGIAEGVCTVTVTSADNPTVKAEIKVTVGKGSAHNFQQINGLTYVDGILVANKSYALPSTYSPEMDATTIQQFNLLSKAAANEGLNIYLSSGYRSYSQQDAIYNNYVSWYGQAQADTFSARPGHSEHQTGLAIDVNTIDDSFAGTPEAIWLENHAHEYGFIIRYPKGKESITGYKYEPWHIRYLGVEKATDVYNSGLTLEEYLGIDSYYH